MVILARYWFIIQDGWNIKLLTSCFTLDQIHDNKAIIIISIVFIVAFGSKAALVLFMWLPKAYAVLNTELAALFAALMTKVGAYALIRFYTSIRSTYG